MDYCFKSNSKLLDTQIFAQKAQENEKDFFSFMKKINLLNDISKSNKSKIYIKANLMTYIHKKGLNYTSVPLLKYLCLFLEKNGLKPIIIESNMFYNTIFPKHTVENISKKLELDFATILNLSKTEVCQFVYEDKVYPISKIFNTNDYYFINFPKIKSHPIFGLTCCIKNLFGCFPEPNKLLQFHKERGIDNSILAINHYLKPDFNLVDAIKCQDQVHDLLPLKLQNYYYPYGYLIGSKNALSIDLLFYDLIHSIKNKHLFQLTDIYEKSYQLKESLPQMRNFKHNSSIEQKIWRQLTKLPYTNPYFKEGMKRIFRRKLQNPKYLWDSDIFQLK